MGVYICKVCNIYIYDEMKGDESSGFPAGMKWEEVPSSWVCPVCGASKQDFKLLDESEVIPSRAKYESFLESKKDQSTDPLTLADVRMVSGERLRGICSVNKICDGSPERLCMGQTYGRPIGLGAAGKGLSFTANVRALDKIRLKQRIVTEHAEPNLSTTIFGKEISIPVIASSLSGVKASMGGSISEMEFAEAVLSGSQDAGTIGFIGNTSDDGQEKTGVEAVKKVGSGIPIFKPQKNERLLELIKMAEDAGALAVGVDLDGVGSTNWERAGKPVFRKTVDELKELADSTDLPFIAKSIMSKEDALDALDAGVDAIDISNHGGRILDSTRGVADVLPEIVEAIDGRITITAGGGIRTGFDVFKVIAMGADAALIGRDVVRAVLGGGSQGVGLHLKYLRSDLRRAMLLTSSNSISDIDKTKLDLPLK